MAKQIQEKSAQATKKDAAENFDADQTAIARFLELAKDKSHIQFRATADGKDLALKIEHPEQVDGLPRLLNALGAGNPHFSIEILNQIATAASLGPGSAQSNANLILSVIQGVAPRDQIETLLAVQLCIIHLAAMTMPHAMAKSERLQEWESVGNMLTKLTRTYLAQMEALKRYRSGDQQNVTVQQTVSVNDGGQAIIGNVNQAEREAGTKPTATAVPELTASAIAPMPIIKDREDAKQPVAAAAKIKRRVMPSK